jgi:hypothetical protein
MEAYQFRLVGVGEAAVILNDHAAPLRLKQAAVKGALGHVCGLVRRYRRGGP